MPIPIVFRKTPSFVKSYDFIDTLTGKGVAIVYCGSSQETGTDAFFLTGNSTIKSKTITVSGGTSNTTSTLVSDEDFDLTVEESFFIQGTFVCNFTFDVISTGAPTTTCHIIVKLRKFDGTTETDIGRQIQRLSNVIRIRANQKHSQDTLTQ